MTRQEYLSIADVPGAKSNPRLRGLPYPQRRPAPGMPNAPRDRLGPDAETPTAPGRQDSCSRLSLPGSSCPAPVRSRRIRRHYRSDFRNYQGGTLERRWDCTPVLRRAAIAGLDHPGRQYNDGGTSDGPDG